MRSPGGWWLFFACWHLRCHTRRVTFTVFFVFTLLRLKRVLALGMSVIASGHAIQPVTVDPHESGRIVEQNLDLPPPPPPKPRNPSWCEHGEKCGDEASGVSGRIQERLVKHFACQVYFQMRGMANGPAHVGAHEKREVILNAILAAPLPRERVSPRGAGPFLATRLRRSAGCRPASYFTGARGVIVRGRKGDGAVCAASARGEGTRRPDSREVVLPTHVAEGGARNVRTERGADVQRQSTTRSLVGRCVGFDTHCHKS